MMELISVGLLLDEKHEELSKKLKNDLIEDFDIEDLDKVDGRKDIMIMFKNPVESKYLHETLSTILGDIGTKKINNE